MKKNTEEKVLKAKGYIASAIEELRELPKKYFEENDIDNCIRDLEDIQIIRL